MPDVRINQVITGKVDLKEMIHRRYCIRSDLEVGKRKAFVKKERVDS
jgi:hypothetical protein